MTTQLTAETLSPIIHKSISVITTELLAQLYGTDNDNIKKNYGRNIDRFVEGKHYFKLEGSELREFKHKVTDCPFVKIAKNVRHLMLWTERGAARHAKMLETDQAWEVFEKLEDCYFSQKSNTSQPKPPKVADASVNAADLLFKLNLICSTWEAARAEIAMFDPKMADHLNKTMNMFWMYTVSMKGIVGRKVTPQLSR